MKVLVAGATGAIGRPLVRQLLGAGHRVAGLTRSPERAAAVAAAGATALVCDVLGDERTLGEKFADFAPDAVVHELTAIPHRLDPRRIAAQLEPTNRLRTEGTRRLVDAARAAGARRFVAQSVAFAYAPGGAPLRREEDPLFHTAPASVRGLIAALARLQDITLTAAGLEGIVLRYGYFYGPGTIYARDGSFAEDVLRRRVPLVGGGRGVFSFIHVDDAAAATVAALDRATPGIYNIVDDRPVAVCEWLPYYAGLLGAKPPMRVPRALARLAAGPYVTHLMCDQPGADNGKAKAALGWRPSRPGIHEGFREMFAAPRAARPSVR